MFLKWVYHKLTFIILQGLILKLPFNIKLYFLNMKDRIPMMTLHILIAAELWRRHRRAVRVSGVRRHLEVVVHHLHSHQALVLQTLRRRPRHSGRSHLGIRLLHPQRRLHLDPCTRPQAFRPRSCHCSKGKSNDQLSTVYFM